jgi:hypothetical protein
MENDRGYNYQEMSYNGQQKKDKGINNDLQNISHKTKDRALRTPIITGGEPRCSGEVNCFNVIA